MHSSHRCFSKHSRFLFSFHTPSQSWSNFWFRGIYIWKILQKITNSPKPKPKLRRYVSTLLHTSYNSHKRKLHKHNSDGWFYAHFTWVISNENWNTSYVKQNFNVCWRRRGDGLKFDELWVLKTIIIFGVLREQNKQTNKTINNNTTKSTGKKNKTKQWNKMRKQINKEDTCTESPYFIVHPSLSSLLMKVDSSMIESVIFKKTYFNLFQLKILIMHIFTSIISDNTS